MMKLFLSQTMCFALAALAAGACVSGPQTREGADVVETTLDQARQADARTCAPQDLASGEAYLAFSRDEWARGHLAEAEKNLDLAQAHAQKALELSASCAVKPAPAAPQVVTLAPKDTDGDGVPDNYDKCPNEPGDPNNDGCPNTTKDSDGDGVMDELDKCPADKGPPENNGCPKSFSDRDNDGLADDQDKCPDDPEDHDSFTDEDGCPDLDNDGDNIPDVADKCPAQPETLNGFQDEDGCPDEVPVQTYKLVVVDREKKQIEIKQKVHFQTGKWKIMPDSFPLLNEVAQALKDNATMEILVEGHTDNVGSDSSNLRLSDNRANSVRDYLTNQGVDGKRLQSMGFGATKPIESNRTSKGREGNRRVEFKIVKE